MKVLVITPESDVHDEAETCNLLLKSNINRLHIRKPTYSKDELKRYLSRLNQEFYSKISLHTHHDLADELYLGGRHFRSKTEVATTCKICSKSFHSMNEIKKELAVLTYGFLSPVFDSISKLGYEGTFDFDTLGNELQKFKKFPVYALGGMKLSKMGQIKKMGFDGLVLLGVVWNSDTSRERMKTVNEIINA